MSFMAYYKRNKLSIANWTYWTLLLYVIAALIWWFLELAQQNNEMMLFRKNLLDANDPNYAQKLAEIVKAHRLNQAQYLGEGITFLALIIIGSVFVYRAVRRQFKLNAQQQNFMMAITHELKTPIAITQLNLQTIKRHNLDQSQQDKLIDITLQETGRLNDLCENILITTRIDSGHYQLQQESTNISLLLTESVEQMKSRFPKRIFETAIIPELFIQGDPFLLQLLFNNLIENAVKYSPAAKAVQIRLNSSTSAVRLTISDEGTGIPASEKQKIFSKFYRIGNENTRKTKGTGLGLYLSQKIAADHHTSITIEDNKPTGSIFAIEFKRNDGSV